MSLLLYCTGCYFSIFNFALVTFIHIFRYFLFRFFIFYIKENFDILLGMLGFIGGIALSLSFLLNRIFLGSPYLTLFITLHFISDDG